MSRDQDKLCRWCKVRPRRASGQGGHGAICTACLWKKTKTSEKAHVRALILNRQASAKYRITPKRGEALKSDNSKAKNRSIYCYLTEAEWVSLWRAAGTVCPICLQGIRNRYDPTSAGRTAHLDHSHEEERLLILEGVDPVEALRRSIRGLVCSWCNHRVLSAVRDAPEIARRAADYLEAPPAHQVLGASR